MPHDLLDKGDVPQLHRVSLRPSTQAVLLQPIADFQRVIELREVITHSDGHISPPAPFPAVRSRPAPPSLSPMTPSRSLPS
ncbi:hypothetical protein AURDEDRAFT_163477 [Auricularia subglabra TFB-10046 SS5]|nr:hypothetical protein AURDEDRAFT_163477 [Auricularia subglabra TFB-10046 SS5]